jgi:hypothetical protein
MLLGVDSLWDRVRRWRQTTLWGERRKRGQRRVAGYSTAPITDEIRQRVLYSPASNFPEMVAGLVRNPKGYGRGGYGVFTEGFKRARELLEGE